MRNLLVDYESILMITSNLSLLLNSGIPLSSTLEILIDCLSSERYKTIIMNIQKEVSEGNSLGEAFMVNSKDFPELYVEMILIGEKSGSLINVLDKITEYYDMVKSWKSKLKNILTYPIILLISVILLLNFYLLFIVPSMKGFILSMNTNVPWYTNEILSFSDYIIESPHIFFGYLIGWGLGIILIISSILSSVRIQEFLYKIKIVQQYNEMLFIYTLYLIISSGISYYNGFEICKYNITNKVIKKDFEKIIEYVNEGLSLLEAIKMLERYSNLSLSMIKSGEESGKLEYNLLRLTKMLQTKFYENLDRKICLVQPIIILIIGVIICILIIIMILPIYSGVNV
ncbi:type II secretion system protein F [Clostridium polyendosporum]|uniref:Type II secretion system protein F n=1 Tax=Clostridium polyendosporum TaxID=69208 RepID=A0A919RWW5_9CLOT|nr:type II secretion system F family protein [Clostridium polyendosporum]GIM27965.1 type II secretion system protein F [Clostridium polyendosporum]